MTPRLVDRIPYERGDGEVWQISEKCHLLVLPEGETVCVSGYRTKDRFEGELLSLQVEKVAKRAGLWLETFLGIDVVMVVVRRDDTAALLKACSEELGRAEGAGG
jgi:hypothetical protein